MQHTSGSDLGISVACPWHICATNFHECNSYKSALVKSSAVRLFAALPVLAHHAAMLRIAATARTPTLTQYPPAQLATVSSAVLQAEGLELMQLILKEKRVARLGSLKVLDFATTRCAPACERWVDLTGLKQLFAIFMGKSKVLSAAI